MRQSLVKLKIEALSTKDCQLFKKLRQFPIPRVIKGRLNLSGK
jgi:hypothetical protein